ncbi:MAG: prepilin-type N-terminal cleavage/methylation domain-containing protein [Terrimicrobiaceae bacterium]|nr:prepilin-type N-terminal cleavage/methylation domain-containing protein [Terrimicrobiaceae bacterium]
MSLGRAKRSGQRGFTLVELLVATAVLLVVMLVLLQLTGGVGQIWRASSGKISAFQNARSAFAVIHRSLARATLNTYNDYVDATGAARTASNTSAFVPDRFARASELHFLSGPAAEIVPGANGLQNPGHAVFFQAPLGETDEANLRTLNRTLNSLGFYIRFGPPDEALLPEWLRSFFGAGSAQRRFRLVQVVEPTEELGVYSSTANGTYSTEWLNPLGNNPPAGAPRARILAEDIPLLVIRPRLAPREEETAASRLGTSYSEATRGSILSPNYHYDSRAWQSGYPSGQRINATAAASQRSAVMRNQVPSIVDIVMVSVDRQSLARFDLTSDSPPEVLRVPAGLFSDASRLDEDLATYSRQLSDAGIRFRTFRTSVELQGAKWSND